MSEDDDKPKTPSERLLQSLDHLIGKDLAQYKEVDKPPRTPGPPEKPEHWKQRDVGYTSDGRAVEVPVPEQDPRTPEEKIQDAKQARLAIELAAMVKERFEKDRRSGLTKDPETRAKEKEVREAKEKEAKEAAPAPTRNPDIQYDSAARRAALARFMESQGVSPELQAIRLQAEVGQGQPPEEAVKKREREAEDLRRAKEIEGRGKEPPAQEPGGKR
jgi:hypothetical protein